jgi:hypothetical protein
VPRYLGTEAVMGNAVTSLATAIGADGSLFLGGRFSGTADFDPTGGIDYRSSTADATGTHDCFITKLNADGSYAWTRTFGGDDEDSVAALAVAADGSLVATGAFRGEVDFDPGVGVALHTAELGVDTPFVVEFGADGAFKWVDTFEDTSRTATGSGKTVTIDPAGGIYVGGNFGPQFGSSRAPFAMDFDPGPRVSNRQGRGYGDVFLVKLTTAGRLTWAGSFDGPTCTMDLSGVAISKAGSVWATGTFYGSCDLDPGPGVAMRVSPGGQDSFIVDLTPGGTLTFAWNFGAVDGVNTSGIAGGTDGAIYVAGDFQGTVDFDPGPAAVARSASYLTGFVLKLAESGAFDWVQKLTALDTVGIAAPSGGGVLVMGNARQLDGGLDSVYVSRLGADQRSSWTLEVGDVSTWLGGLAVSPVGFTFVATQSDNADLAPGPVVDTIVGPASILSRYAF